MNKLTIGALAALALALASWPALAKPIILSSVPFPHYNIEPGCYALSGLKAAHARSNHMTLTEVGQIAFDCITAERAALLDIGNRWPPGVPDRFPEDLERACVAREAEMQITPAAHDPAEAWIITMSMRYRMLASCLRKGQP